MGMCLTGKQRAESEARPGVCKDLVRGSLQRPVAKLRAAAGPTAGDVLKKIVSISYFYTGELSPSRQDVLFPFAFLFHFLKLHSWLP